MLLTANQVAAISKDKLTAERIKQFCRSGRLPATKVGRLWLIKESDFKKFESTPRANGRPKLDE